MATYNISPTKFGPLDFKDVWLWLDPSDTHVNYNYYDAAEDEYFWKDKSYVNQWTSYWDVATARPDSTINGLTVMDFGAEGDIEVEGPEGETKIPQSGTTTFFFLLQMDAADDDYIVFHDSTSWERYFLRGKTGATDPPHINAGSPTYWVDGVQQSWSTQDDVYTGLGSTVRIVMVENVDLFAQDTSQSPVSNQWAWLSIGAWDADEHTDNMKMGEVIALPGTLTQTERQDVEGYLAWKWGKQTDLPAGHPWLNQAPTAYRSPKPATLITLPVIEYNTNIGTAGAAPGGAGRFSPYDQTSAILLMVDHEDTAASDALPRLAEWVALDQHYLVIDGVDTEVTLNSFTARSDRYDLILARTAQLWTDISTATTISLQTNPAPQPAGVITYDISGDTSNFELWLDASDASTITEETANLTTLLLNANGTDGSTTFTDSSQSNLTVTSFNSAQISTTQSKNGGSSAYFPNSNSWLEIAQNDALNLTGDFTIEWWMYPTAATSRHILDHKTPQAYTTNKNFILWHHPSYQNQVSYWSFSSGSNVRLSSGTLALNTWHHIAIVRSGTNCEMFVNGVSVGTNTHSQSANFSGGGTLIGGASYSSLGFPGYIDDLRITKVALYTAAFTPQATELTTGEVADIAYDTNIGTGGAAPGGAGRFSPYDQTSAILLMVDHEDTAASDALPRLADWVAQTRTFLKIDGVDTEVTLNSFTARSDRYDLTLTRTAQLWTDISTATTLTLIADPQLNSTGVSQINDKSGNSRHVLQSSSTARPVMVNGEYNGLNTLRFGTGIWMDGRGASTFFPIANRAYYFAIKPTGGTDSDTLFSFVSAGSGESYSRHNGMEFYSASSGGAVATVSGGFELAYDDNYTWGPWPVGFIYCIDGGNKTYHRVSFRSTSIQQSTLSGTTAVAESATVHEGLMLGAVLKSNVVDEKNARFDLCELIVTTDTTRETGYRIQKYLYEKWYRSDYEGFVSRWGQRANIDNWNWRVPATKSTDDEIEIRISSSGGGYPPLPNQGQIFPYH